MIKLTFSFKPEEMSQKFNVEADNTTSFESIMLAANLIADIKKYFPEDYNRREIFKVLKNLVKILEKEKDGEDE